MQYPDVKAMFNGGSRKRAMAAGLNSHSRSGHSSQEFLKRQNISSSSPESNQSLTPNTTMSDSLSPKSTPNVPPTYFPLIPLPNKYSLPSNAPFNASPSMQSSPPVKALSTTHPTDFRQSFAEFMWVGSGKPPALHIPYSCLLWPRPPTSSLEFGSAEVNRNKLLFGGVETNCSMFSPTQREPLWAHEPLETRDANNNSTQPHPSHTSAFKPVTKSNAPNVSPTGHSFERFAKSPANTSPSPEPSQVNSDNDPEVDILGEGGDESNSADNKKEETDKQNCVQNRKNKSYLMSDNDTNGSDRKRTKFDSSDNRHESLNLNFLGHLSEV